MDKFNQLSKKPSHKKNSSEFTLKTINIQKDEIEIEPENLIFTPDKDRKPDPRS